MRNKYAAANWKMNLTLPKAEELLDNILSVLKEQPDNHKVVFAVPFPYLQVAREKVNGYRNVYIAAQNCYNKKSGAYTGEVSAEMLQSLEIPFVVLGHSERREYFHESNQVLAEKIDLALEYQLQPIFCCGEPLNIREEGTQNEYVARQLEESLYHLHKDDLKKIVIAYEPIWAIGTGKTASSEQAQEMHAFIRQQLAAKYGQEVADEISILYGGSVKAANARELFAQPDVDGGLVGGASLVAEEFNVIIEALS
jgi:triosephosphate isomerase